MADEFIIKDSGERKMFSSGMARDTDEGKPRYDLIDRDGLYRCAMHMARGSIKYGERNWEQANSEEEANRFKASAFRHFMQWLDGERDEDHMAAVVFNLFAAERTEIRAEGTRLKEDLKEAYLNPQGSYTQEVWEKLVD